MRRLAVACVLTLGLAGCAPEPPSLTWTPVAPRPGTELTLTGKRFPSERPLEIWLQRAPVGQAVQHVRGAEPWAVRIDARDADAAGGFELKYRLRADLGKITDSHGLPAGILKVEPGHGYAWIVYYGDAAAPLERPFSVDRARP
jgi:hypothetical protein